MLTEGIMTLYSLIQESAYSLSAISVTQCSPSKIFKLGFRPIVGLGGYALWEAGCSNATFSDLEDSSSHGALSFSTQTPYKVRVATFSYGSGSYNRPTSESCKFCIRY